VKTRYVLNRRSLVLHRLPTQEQCNVDSVPRSRRRYFASTKAAARADAYLSLCLHCLGRETSRKRT
jgi:hypothetical protein